MAVCAQGATYQVRSRADKRQRLSILTDVSAYFSPAEMSAVMGPSGSGALSSWLQVSACRKPVAARCAEPVLTFQGHASPRAAVPLHRLRHYLLRCQLRNAPGPAVCKRISSCCCPAALLRADEGGKSQVGAVGSGGWTLDGWVSCRANAHKHVSGPSNVSQHLQASPRC